MRKLYTAVEQCFKQQHENLKLFQTV